MCELAEYFRALIAQVLNLPCNSIIGVRTHRAIRYWPYTLLLNGIVRKCFTKAMLAKPHSLWYSVLESDHVVLPVTYMITDDHASDSIAQIERVKVHIEGIDQARAVVINDDRAACGSFCFAGAIRLNSVQPWRVDGNVDIRREINCAIGGVQIVEIVQSERIWSAGHNREVYFWLSII